MSEAYVLFDLDDTLYPAGAGLMKQISARMTSYLANHLGISWEAADARRRECYLRYGSAVRALVTQYQLDFTDFLAYAHDVDVEALLARDADLDCLLGCLEAPKAIFTNAPHAYAERVLRALGIGQHFACLFDYEFGDGRGKPDAAVYRKLQAAVGVSGSELVIVEDAPKNLAPARALGWTTIWVNPNGTAVETPVDYEVRDLWQVAEAFHQLGVMDASHRVMAEHRLAGCAWAERTKTDAV